MYVNCLVYSTLHWVVKHRD